MWLSKAGLDWEPEAFVACHHWKAHKLQPSEALSTLWKVTCSRKEVEISTWRESFVERQKAWRERVLERDWESENLSFCYRFFL